MEIRADSYQLPTITRGGGNVEIRFKSILCFVLIFCTVAPVFGDTEAMQRIKVFSDESVNGAVAVTGIAIPLVPYKNFGIWLQATSVSGTPDLTLHYEVSHNPDSANFCVSERSLYVFGPNPELDTTIADENPHTEAISPVCMAYIRFVITGGAANPADTVVTVWACLQ